MNVGVYLFYLVLYCTILCSAENTKYYTPQHLCRFPPHFLCSTCTVKGWNCTPVYMHMDIQIYTDIGYKLLVSTPPGKRGMMATLNQWLNTAAAARLSSFLWLLFLILFTLVAVFYFTVFLTYYFALCSLIYLFFFAYFTSLFFFLLKYSNFFHYCWPLLISLVCFYLNWQRNDAATGECTNNLPVSHTSNHHSFC